MSKYKIKTSPETVKEAEKIAKATQRPGQTKEQTKLIAQGIQKGIEQYKKQFKARSRELDKKLKSVKNNHSNDGKKQFEDITEVKVEQKNSFAIALPWGLLILSWIGFFFWYQ